MEEFNYIVNKYTMSAKISAAFAIIAFFLAFFTGFFYQNQFIDILLRSFIAMMIFGLLGYTLGFLLANTLTRKEEEIHDSDILEEMNTE